MHDLPGVVLGQLHRCRADGEESGTFTSGPLLTLTQFTRGHGLPLPTLLLAAFVGFAFEAFTLPLLLFTLAFTAFTGLALRLLASLVLLAFLTPRGLFPLGLFTGQPRLMLALLTHQLGGVVAFLAGPPLLSLTPLGGSLLALGLAFCRASCAIRAAVMARR